MFKEFVLKVLFNFVIIEINYSFDTNLGSLNMALRGTHILKYEIPDVLGRSKDVVGLFNHDNFAGFKLARL